MLIKKLLTMSMQTKEPTRGVLRATIVTETAWWVFARIRNVLGLLRNASEGGFTHCHQERENNCEHQSRPQIGNSELALVFNGNFTQTIMV